MAGPSRALVCGPRGGDLVNDETLVFAVLPPKNESFLCGRGTVTDVGLLSTRVDSSGCMICCYSIFRTVRTERYVPM